MRVTEIMSELEITFEQLMGFLELNLQKHEECLEAIALLNQSIVELVQDLSKF